MRCNKLKNYISGEMFVDVDHDSTYYKLEVRAV